MRRRRRSTGPLMKHQRVRSTAFHSAPGSLSARLEFLRTQPVTPSPRAAHVILRPDNACSIATNVLAARLAVSCALRAWYQVAHYSTAAARARVWRWAGDVIGISQPTTAMSAGGTRTSGGADASETVADLIDRTQPESRMERILVVASWLEGRASQTITDALSRLIAKKPALVRQIRKMLRLHARSRARKVVTVAGYLWIE